LLIAVDFNRATPGRARRSDQRPEEETRRNFTILRLRNIDSDEFGRKSHDP